MQTSTPWSEVQFFEIYASGFSMCWLASIYSGKGSTYLRLGLLLSLMQIKKDFFATRPH